MTDVNFVELLDEASLNIGKSPIKSIELSGWSEEQDIENVRKSLKSEKNTRRHNSKNSNRSSRLSNRTSKRTQIPSIYSFHLRYPENSFKIRSQSNNHSINHSKKTSLDICLNTKSFHLPRPSTKNQNSSKSNQKPLKLFEYYDRSFIIVEKSPPTVSGYSVTFYRK